MNFGPRSSQVNRRRTAPRCSSVIVASPEQELVFQRWKSCCENVGNGGWKKTQVSSGDEFLLGMVFGGFNTRVMLSAFASLISMLYIIYTVCLSLCVSIYYTHAGLSITCWGLRVESMICFSGVGGENMRNSFAGGWVGGDWIWTQCTN